MNECFFLGNVIEIGNFKFIINKNKEHKSQIDMKIRLIDKTIINVIAYDKMADYIIRKKFLNKTILIQGHLRKNYVEIYYIEEKGEVK